MTRMARWWPVLLLPAILTTMARRPRAADSPAGAAEGDAVYTSTREVTGLCVAPDGTLWAATSGGVLARAPDGAWRKWTRLDGLPSHEARGVRLDGPTVTVDFPTASAVWTGEAWRVTPNPPPTGPPAVTAAWSGQTYVATTSGLSIGVAKGGPAVQLPPSSGTHVSALLPRGDDLWAALYGDGLWAWNGTAWRRLDLGLPDAAREVTALAAAGDTLWLGTRRSGVWRHEGKVWTNFARPNELPAHNIQSLALFRGDLFSGTLEDGLVIRAPRGWESARVPVLSSDAPRQMAVFGDRLYLRHGNGKVDAFDGSRWTKDVFARLPRKQVSALAADDRRLYAAQWGGWSEWDGAAWVHHLGLKELQGYPVTALLPDGDTLWVGTQGKGLAEVNRATMSVRWHGPAQGLSDDWVTALCRDAETLCAGTFVGGLARRSGDRWATSLPGQNVTALAPDGRGGLLIGTRAGLYETRRDGPPQKVNRPALDSEIQALCPAPTGLWVGSRTGLAFVRDEG